MIGSLTPTNEGDMDLDECRKAWPDKLFWSNIRISDYDLSPEELHERIYELVEKAAPDGRKLAFEVSEDIPHNWRTSIPIVLDVLNCLTDEGDLHEKLFSKVMEILESRIFLNQNLKRERFCSNVARATISP